MFYEITYDLSDRVTANDSTEPLVGTRTLDTEVDHQDTRPVYTRITSDIPCRDFYYFDIAEKI